MMMTWIDVDDTTQTPFDGETVLLSIVETLGDNQSPKVIKAVYSAVTCSYDSLELQPLSASSVGDMISICPMYWMRIIPQVKPTLVSEITSSPQNGYVLSSTGLYVLVLGTETNAVTMEYFFVVGP